MGICGCGDRCTCSITGGTNVTVTGSGDSNNPYIISATDVTFDASNTDNTIVITPGGPDGHSPVINTAVSSDSGNILTKHADGLYVSASATVAAVRIIGELIDVSGLTTPALTLEADGSEYPVASYTLLAGEYGATGVGDGIWDTGGETPGFFRVPDLNGRQSVGRNTATATDIGDTDALAAASRSNTHTHTGPSHTHSVTTTGSTTSISTTQSGVNDSTETGVGAGYSQADWNAVTDPHNGAGNRVTAVSVAANGHHHDISHTHTTASSGTTGPAGTGATGATTIPYAVVRKVVFAGV